MTPKSLVFWSLLTDPAVRLLRVFDTTRSQGSSSKRCPGKEVKAIKQNIDVWSLDGLVEGVSEGLVRMASQRE